MDQNQAAYLIQKAWHQYYNSLWEPPVSVCHPGPFCGDWMCNGDWCRKF